MSQARLRIRARDDLDGTHQAVIKTEYPAISEAARPRAHTPAFIKLTCGVKACGCLVGGVEYGRDNLVWADRYKLDSLGAHDGDWVTVESLAVPPPASRVRLRTSAELAPRDYVWLQGKPLTQGERTAVFRFSGEAVHLTVDETEPGGFVVVGAETTLDTAVSAGDADAGLTTYRDVGGLDREIQQLRELVEYPLRFPDVFAHLGIVQPSGVILFGPPGTGKTLIVRALSHEVGAKFFLINGPEVFSQWYGASESKLREIFSEAADKAPSVILIDELDSLVPKRGTHQGELEQRVVASLLTLMDGVKKRKGVVVIGTTNRINAIDPALRREGRFGQEIHIGIPNAKGREQILRIQTRRMPLAADVQLDLLAAKTAGFVGADLESLCRQAAYQALRRTFSDEEFGAGTVEVRDDLRVAQADFQSVLPGIPPSALRELLVEVPQVTWDEIGGLAEVKRLLLENITYPMTRQAAYHKAGVKPARGILLFGPPGTGKTLLARAVATQCSANFISVEGPEIRSKWIGESEERIRFLFSKAREVAPCVVFFDEIDAAAPARGREATTNTDTIVNQILCEMDGIEGAEAVFVIGATNRAELLDPALLRPGRFDYQVEVPLPDAAARASILQHNLRNKPRADLSVDELVTLTEGFSGADLAEVCRRAALAALREADYEADRVLVQRHHVMDAISALRQTKSRLEPREIGFHTTAKP